MRYKRDEPFRYVFGEPIPALIQLVKVHNHPIQSSFGEAEIIDLSPEGLRLSTNLEIPEKTVEIEIKFTLNKKEMNLIGDIVWHKQIGSIFDYGLELMMTEEQRNYLVNELKQYVKN